MSIFTDLPKLFASKAVANPGKTVAIGGSSVIFTSVANAQTPNPPVKPASGPLAALESSPFSFDRLHYPLTDLGEGLRYPHYVTFYINARTQSKYLQEKQVNTLNRESVLQRNARQRAGYDNINLPIIGDTVNFRRKTTRTTQAIRLYMPDTMHWAFRNQWKDMSLTDVLPSIATKATELGSDLVGAIRGGIADGSSLSKMAGDILKSTAPLGVEQLAGKLGIDRDLAVSSLGYAVNPNIDVIYGAPDLRSFVFDFMFAPRSTKEASEVLAIIRAFKFHAAPESSPDSGAGRYWIPPTEFDIEFSTESMGKVSTCVLEQIDVDYAPNGWAAYQEELSKNDMPVNIRMQLVFKELEYITKELVEKGY